MNKKRHLILLIILCLTSLCIHAQESSSRQIYNQAESEYTIGRIDQAIQLLQDNLDKFNGLLKQSAYRLLALCYLSEDRDEEARHYAGQLVKLNNYYNSTEDPARFQDLIEQLKEGITTTITTASSQSETINEAPVPITIITSEMIEELGYNKNLGQILSAYVPGIAEITSYEEGVNLSMHGAYANGQELILIMENGHRLNSRFDNSGPTSYSVSTDKIDHIEVLRGPASSLYGNVALSAVVNIITKNGRAIDGLKLKYGHATYNTHKADLSMGTQFMDADIFGWASIYYSDGQIRHYGDGKGYLMKSYVKEDDMSYVKKKYISPDITYVDGYKDSPAYDFGLSFKLKGFDLMFSKKNVKKVFQNTPSYGGYEYDRFYSIFGLKPGNRTESTHAEIGYTQQFRNIFLNASFYSDWYGISNYDVSYDSIVTLSPIMDGDEYVYDKYGNIEYEEEGGYGEYNFSKFNERTMGGIVKAHTDYQLGHMRGNILVGGQYERFSLQSVVYLWGRKDGRIENGQVGYDEFYKFGDEKILSLFIQDKHYFLPQLILNAGLRYDTKYRKEEKSVRTYSPRLALLYVPDERFSLKLSYSEAYTDLCFYYRYILKSSYTSMSPQHLSSLQLTAMGTIQPLHLNYEANIFYNKYSNLLCWQSREDHSGDNSGQLTNIGVEGTANMAYKRFSANLSFYYCRDIESINYYYNTSEKLVCGVPHFTFNLHGAWKLIQGKSHELKVYGHSTYLGKKLNFTDSEEEDYFVEGEILFGLGIKYGYKQRLQLSLDCENIFDTDHYICGASYQTVPKFQRGRTLMAALSFQF